MSEVPLCSPSALTSRLEAEGECSGLRGGLGTENQRNQNPGRPSQPLQPTVVDVLGLRFEAEREGSGLRGGLGLRARVDARHECADRCAHLLGRLRQRGSHVSIDPKLTLVTILVTACVRVCFRAHPPGAPSSGVWGRL